MKFHFDILAPVYDRLIGSREPEKLLKLLALDNIENFIEIGGGTGRFTKYFSPYAKNTWLLDPSLPMLKQAKLKFPQYKLVNGYAQDLPFPKNYFDLVLIYDSLHHWNDQMEALKEVYRVIRPSKKLVLGEIHPSHRAGYFVGMMENFFRMKSTFLTPKELVNMLEEIGFKITKKGWLNKPTYYLVAEK